MSTLKSRKRKLQREIIVARKHLNRNTREFDLGDYSALLGSPLTSKIAHNPGLIISTMDQVARTVLPQHNSLRSILKYINATLKLTKWL